MRELSNIEVMQVQGAAGNKYWFSSMIDSALSYGFTMGAADVVIRMVLASSSKGDLFSYGYMMKYGFEGFVIGAVAGAAKEGVRKLNEKLELY